MKNRKPESSTLIGSQTGIVNVFRVDPPGTGRVLRHSFYENGHARQTCVACGLGLRDAVTVPECKRRRDAMIREARSSDLARVILCELEHTTRARWLLEQYAAIGAVCFVEDRGKAAEGPRGVVGALWCRAYRGRLEVISVTVLKAARARGIAKRLLHHAHEHARSLGLKAAFLDVVCHNAAAITCYSGMGYRKTKDNRGVWRMKCDL